MTAIPCDDGDFGDRFTAPQILQSDNGGGNAQLPHQETHA
jgi:hypothetical protein